jgi:hypothetical protein
LDDQDADPLPVGDASQRQVDFFRKSFSSVLTLGAGNSLGPEGPSVELGANVTKVLLLLLPELSYASLSYTGIHQASPVDLARRCFPHCRRLCPQGAFYFSTRRVMEYSPRLPFFGRNARRLQLRLGPLV